MRLTTTLIALALGGCVTIDNRNSPPPAACPAASRNWTAYVNAMPGPDARPTLIVAGEVDAPRGFVPVLTAGPTDRRFPPGQRFALSLAAAPGAPAGWRPVRGQIRPALAQYGEVIVGCGGAVVARIAPVERVY